MFRRHFLGHTAAGTAGCLGFAGCKPHDLFHGNPKFRAKMGKMMLEHVAGELDLTETQKAELEKIHADIKAKHESVHDKKKSKIETVLDQVRQDSLDREKLSAVFDGKQQCVEDMQPFLMDKFSEFHAVLTPEQRNKLADKLEEFHTKHQGGC